VGRIRPEAEGLSGAAAYCSGRPSRRRGPAGPRTRDMRHARGAPWGVVTAPLAGAATSNGSVDPVWQGGRVSTRMLNGGHRREEGAVGSPRRRLNVQWWSGGGATVFGGGGGGGGFSMAGDDATVVLHLGERERKVRWGSNRWKEARASSSPRGRKAAASRRKPKRSDGLRCPRLGKF
jgi:hypothetical protein